MKIIIISTIFILFSSFSHSGPLDLKLIEESSKNSQSSCQLVETLLSNKKIVFEAAVLNKALVSAVRSRNWCHAKVLLDYGASPNTTINGNSILYYVYLGTERYSDNDFTGDCQDREFVHKLIEKGISRSILNGYVRDEKHLVFSDLGTPLFLAIENNDLKTVQMLVEAGANANGNVWGYRGETLVSCAAERGYKDIVVYLLENGAKVTEHTLGRARNSEVVNILLDYYQ